MVIILSPAKALDVSKQHQISDYTVPDYLSEAQLLVGELKKYDVKKITSLMKVSQDIAQLNVERYAQWQPPFLPENAKQALLAFNGEVFRGINADSYTGKDFHYAQDHLRILSGLYGVLRPLDLIQPYRLEMGTKLKNSKGKDLYAFWGEKIAEKINELLENQREKVLVNLASNEYYKAVKPKQIHGQIITPVFKESKGDALKTIMVYAKKARGLMASFIIKNRMEKAEEIKHFDQEGYFYNDRLSSANEWVFTR